ncbi:unnamed protein product [Sphacelaria rigidula]
MEVGGEISDRVAQREGRWKSDAYKAYTVNNILATSIAHSWRQEKGS